MGDAVKQHVCMCGNGGVGGKCMCSHSGGKGNVYTQLFGRELRCPEISL